MDKNDLERRLEAAEKQNLGILDEIKNLKAQLAKMQDEPEIPDFPVFHRDEPYWAMDGDMFVYGGEASGAIDDDDFNIFHTAEYAKLFADKCREIAMLLHCKWYLDRDFVPDFTIHTQTKFVVYYDNFPKRYTIECWNAGTNNTRDAICFSSEENARKARDWMNAHAKRGAE